MAYASATKARTVLGVISKSLLSLPFIDMKTYFKVFDTKVAPVMLYGCELWGMMNIQAIENVQTYMHVSVFLVLL